MSTICTYLGFLNIFSPFIYLAGSSLIWMCRLFVAVLGLLRLRRAGFSLVELHRLQSLRLSSCGAQA